MQINVLLSATLKDIIGQNRLSINLDGSSATVLDVRRALSDRYPQAEANLSVALASINREYAFNQDTVNDGDEVAFFPPVSGGSNDASDPECPEIYLLPTGPIDHDELIAAITTPATGAVCLFSGMVRGATNRDGHLPRTRHLEYEAYEPMALEKMRQVAAEIRQQWPKVIGIAMAQRLGKLEVRQNTVLIACSSPHRDDGCFEAARYGIDRLKEIVPVWKKEVGVDGEVWVEGGYHPTPADRNR
jgi:MoaE-MoaD fusion protein